MRRKNTKYRHQMCSFKLQTHQTPFSAQAPPRTPLEDLRTLPIPHSPLRRGDLWRGNTTSPHSSPDTLGVSISSRRLWHLGS